MMRVMRCASIGLPAALLVLSVAACAAGAYPPTPAAAQQRAVAHIESRRADLIAFRRDLHRHPELSGAEEWTSRVVAERLEELGFDVRRGVGGHGVVAYLQGGRPGGLIAFRADLDAVRSEAPDPVDFASAHPGVRHICGHDIHTSIGVALAEGFAAIRPELRGGVMLVFQPAEETATGAARMIDEGAFEDRLPDAIFAVHTAPYEVGLIAAADAAMMAARDRVIARVEGSPAAADALRQRFLALGDVGDFAARPIGDDFIRAEARSAPTAQGVTEVTAVFTLGTTAARERAHAAVARLVNDVERAYPEARVEATYEAAWVPGVTNDTALVRAAADSIRSELGADAFVRLERMSPVFSEDFGHMQALMPGAMFFLGVSNADRGWIGLPHSPDYVADEEAIFVGSRAMMRVMLDALSDR